MKRGPYNKSGKWAVVLTKYCPCTREGKKVNGVYIKDQGTYICEDCWNRERRFNAATSGPLERRGVREKPSLIQEMEAVS